MSTWCLRPIRMSLILVLCINGFALAQKAGDRVIAKAELTLRLSEKIVETVARNTVLKVEETNGLWLWVKSPSGKKGWVKNNEVVEAPPDLPPRSRDDPSLSPESPTDNAIKRPTVGGTGTAFVVHPNGYLVTNAHVVRPWKDFYEVEESAITVTLNGKQYKAELLGFNKARDLAILKIDAKGLPALPLGNSDNAQLSEEVRAFGYPLGASLGTNIKVTRGTISGIEKFADGKTILTDTGINPGNSGGPLINDKGEVVGVVTAKLKKEVGDNVGFCVPINDVKKMLEAQGVNLMAPRERETLNGVTIAKQSAPAVAFVRMNALQWSFYVDAGKATSNTVKDIEFDPNGKLMAVLSEGGEYISVWDYQTPQRLLAIDKSDVSSKHFGNAYDLAFTPDGKYLGWVGHGIGAVRYGKDDDVNLWDLTKGKMEWTRKVPDTEFHQSANRLCFSPDGELVAIGSDYELIMISKMPGAYPVKHQLRAKNSGIYKVEFSKDSKLLVTTDGDRDTRVWDVDQGTVRYSFDGDGSTTFSSDGAKLITVNNLDERLVIRNATTGEMIKEFDRGVGKWCYSFSKGDLDGVVSFNDYQSFVGAMDLDGKWLFRFKCEFDKHYKRKGDLTAGEISADGRTLAVGHRNGWVTVWQTDYLLSKGMKRESAVATITDNGNDPYDGVYGTDGFNIDITNDGNLSESDVVQLLHDLNVFGDVGDVTLDGIRLTPRIWAELKQIENLSAFCVSTAPIAEGDLSGLGQLKKLKYFTIISSDFSTTELKHLRSLPADAQIRLIVNGSKIDDESLEFLVGLKLENLGVGNSLVTDAGLREIALITSLEDINLSGTKISDAGLLHLLRLPKLKSLNLQNTQIGDVGLRHLSSLKTIGFLELQNTNVTDDSVDVLRKMTSLDYLYLKDTKMTDAGLARLKKALPKCHIEK